MAPAPPESPKPPAGCATNAVAVFFLGCFLAAGLFFCAMIGREVFQAWESRAWARVPCTVVESRVQVDDDAADPYRAVVRFRYTASGGGGERVSGDWRRKKVAFDDSSKAQRVVDRYPVGTTTSCYVDPAEPSRAVLEHGEVWIALFTPLPLLFVLIGGGGIWFTLRPGAPDAQKPKALSEAADTAGRGAAVVFWIFFLVGAGLSIPLLAVPLERLARSQSWPAVPCTIVDSQVRSHSDGEGTSYRADVLYRYVYNGQTRLSNRYNLAPLNVNGGRAGSMAVVRQYKPGAAATCWVDPSDPALAVLSRAPSWALAFGLIPVAFLLVGFFGIRSQRRKRREADVLEAARARLSTPRASAGAFGRVSPGAYRPTGGGAATSLTLKPAGGPWAKFLGLVLFGVIWNGILSIFLYQLFADSRRGGFDACLAAFLVPFVLIGAGVIIAAVHALLATFNPRPMLMLADGDLRPGATTELRWRFDGRYDRIGRLVIRLEGREEATYRRGTDTRTDKHVFHETQLVDSSRGGSIGSGSVKLTVPPRTMHSFASRNNKIVWEITVHGDIAGWPDVKQSFPVRVLPITAAEVSEVMP